MKFVFAVVLFFAGVTAFADLDQPKCETMYVCGSYTGQATISDGGPTYIVLNETVFLEQSTTNNGELFMTVAVTYKNGDQEKHQFSLVFRDEEFFDVKSGETVVGSGQCRFGTCFYDRATAEATFHGIIRFHFDNQSGNSYIDRSEDRYDTDGIKRSWLNSTLTMNNWKVLDDKP